MLDFYIIANMGFWILVMTGQALLMSPKGRNASRDGLVKLWEGGFCYLQYYYIVKLPRHSCEHAYRARRLPLQLNKSMYDTVVVITYYGHRGRGFK